MSNKLTARGTNGARHIVLPSFHKSVAMEPWGSTVDHTDLTVVVVNYNTAHLLYRMFAALEAAGVKTVRSPADLGAAMLALLSK